MRRSVLELQMPTPDRVVSEDILVEKEGDCSVHIVQVLSCLQVNRPDKLQRASNAQNNVRRYVLAGDLRRALAAVALTYLLKADVVMYYSAETTARS
jgi:hypothetical protein